MTIHEQGQLLPIPPLLAPIVLGIWLVAPAVTGRAQAATSPDEVIVWSASRPLTWNDFKAKPPHGELAARSAINHSYSVGCSDNTLHVRVQTVFLPAQSWVSDRILLSGLPSRLGLAHEQVHFDLAEVAARRARKLLRELVNPCARSDAELNALVEKVLGTLQATQRQYDLESATGSAEAQQFQWAARVAADLKALRSFADSR